MIKISLSILLIYIQYCQTHLRKLSATAASNNTINLIRLYGTFKEKMKSCSTLATITQVIYNNIIK